MKRARVHSVPSTFASLGLKPANRFIRWSRDNLAKNRGRENRRQPAPVRSAGKAEHVHAQTGVGEEHWQEEHQRKLTDLCAPGLDEAFVVMK